MNKYLIIICVVLGIVSTTLFSYVGKLKDEKERLSGNQQALMEKIEFYQTEAGKSAASVQKLELSKSELEEHCSDLMQTIDQLNIKVKGWRLLQLLQQKRILILAHLFVTA